MGRNESEFPATDEVKGAGDCKCAVEAGWPTAETAWQVVASKALFRSLQRKLLEGSPFVGFT